MAPGVIKNILFKKFLNKEKIEKKERYSYI